MECIRTSVPRSEAVASSLPSSDSAMHTSGELCAWMNLVRRTSYSSTRTCSMLLSCCAACRRLVGGARGSALMGQSPAALVASAQPLATL